MISLRNMISGLVVIAIALAPTLAAWASVPNIASKAPLTAHVWAIDSSGPGFDGTMEDCASMMKAAGVAHDCPCCDEDKACPPEFCFTKCFQLLGLAQQALAVATVVTALLWPTGPARPPDWSDQPRPPPPRT